LLSRGEVKPPRYADKVFPPKEETRSADDIISAIKQNLAGKEDEK
jgi:hypothetical protein